MKEKPTDIIYIGMALIDSIVREFDPVPVSASGYRAASGSMHAGGEAVNGAVAAAKLGLKSAILCALGNDAAGDIVIQILEKYGVDTTNVLRPDDHSTPITTMLVEADGKRKSITNSSHKYNFHPEGYTECLAVAKIVALSSLFRAPFDDAEIIKSVVQKAKDNGSLVFADTKIPNFRELNLSDIKASLPMIDYIFPNEDEAKHFTGKQKTEEMAEVFLDHGVKNVIIKLGAEGSFFMDHKKSFYTEPFRVEAKDSTGAGDNFIAAFAAEILSGKSHEEALRFANACGALSTTKEGALDGVEGRAQVDGFIKEQA